MARRESLLSGRVFLSLSAQECDLIAQALDNYADLGTNPLATPMVRRMVLLFNSTAPDGPYPIEPEPCS